MGIAGVLDEILIVFWIYAQRTTPGQMAWGTLIKKSINLHVNGFRSDRSRRTTRTARYFGADGFA